MRSVFDIILGQYYSSIEVLPHYRVHHDVYLLDLACGVANRDYWRDSTCHLCINPRRQLFQLPIGPIPAGQGNLDVVLVVTPEVPVEVENHVIVRGAGYGADVLLAMLGVALE